MLHLRICAVLMVFLVSTANASQAPSFELPADSSVPVITLNYVGGLTVLPRQNIIPVLTVRGDGRVTIVDSLGRTKAIEGQIPLEEIQELLRFSIDEQDFPQFSTGDAQQEIAVQNARCGRSMKVEDAGTTIIHIQTADMEHEGRYTALGVFAAAYPGVKSLGQLWAIERRLGNLMEEVKAGGKDAVAAALDEANKFAKQRQDAIDFRIEDFQRTVISTDGRKMLEFARDREDGTSISVNVEYKSGRPPSVSSRSSIKLPVNTTVNSPVNTSLNTSLNTPLNTPLNTTMTCP
jgi:hypothetical protein